MNIFDLLRRGPIRAPEGETGAGEGGDGGGNGTPPPGGAGGEPGGEGNPPPPAAKWFEADTWSPDERNWLDRKGLSLDDPNEALAKAIRGHRAAEQRLGKPADEIMDRPKKDQPLAEFMRANAETFGIPDKPEGYEIEKPELPQGMEWDSGLEGKLRQVAHENGLPPGAVNALVATYAEHMGGIYASAGDELQTATAEMMSQLRKDWGDQTDAKMQLARQGAAAVAEEAGFDNDAMQNLTAALREKVGDPAIMRMFAAIGGMMGEDQLEGLGRGPSSIGSTPQEARQRLAELRSKDGEYGRAYAAGDRATMSRLQPEIDRLTKIAAGGR